ncbi:endonuclease III domain-containing protein [Geotalea uraniireducens]|uniref:DNA-3-methyladenine glycosylase III n=1 Tax=Geotalea uraniireducens (strain Rf4) TaxID=351605 RepID=A5GDD3_GEOUR|nr:endonuclease III domain-containing protein [Geotalea uraniireducens]ABQ24412.1 DNA-3-methyladenine glycosylase III [Geotalea uraniireducens Rf4]
MGDRLMMPHNVNAAGNIFLDIFRILLDRYGPLHWWPAETPFEVCVGAILTQNTNWGNVEKAIGNLKKEGLLSAEAMRDVPVERLAEVIRPAGFFNVKSARLKDFVAWLFMRHDGKLKQMFSGDWQDLRKELLQVRGIGRETCDSILLYAGNKPSFVVDAYTKRLFAHLDVISEKADYEEIRALFMENLPEDVEMFNEYHALIVQHCKEHCRKKPLCPGCDLHFSCKAV